VIRLRFRALALSAEVFSTARLHAGKTEFREAIQVIRAVRSIYTRISLPFFGKM
jgi:hypothetical protein